MNYETGNIYVNDELTGLVQPYTDRDIRMTLRQCDFHRNGVGGEGVYLGIVDIDDLTQPDLSGRFLIAQFGNDDEEEDEQRTLPWRMHRARTVSLRIDKLTEPKNGVIPGVAFFLNSWRSADYHGIPFRVLFAEHEYLVDVQRMGYASATEFAQGSEKGRVVRSYIYEVGASLRLEHHYDR